MIGVWFAVSLAMVIFLISILAAWFGSSEEEPGAAVAMYLFGAAIVAAAVGAAFFEGKEQAVKETIDHGAAEWRCDPVTGAKELHWLVEKKEE